MSETLPSNAELAAALESRFIPIKDDALLHELLWGDNPLKWSDK